MKSWLDRNRIYFCSGNFFLIIMVWIFWQLKSMDQPLFGSKEADALKITLMARPDLFDRKMICCLSVVSMGCCRIIRDTVQSRKNHKQDCRDLVLNSDSLTRRQRFFDLDPHLKLMENLVWNQYGTACATASFGSSLKWTLYHEELPVGFCERENRLILEQRLLLDDKSVGNCILWDDFYDVLPHRPLLFFDNNGDVCFHACGGEKKSDAHGFDVLEYRLSSDIWRAGIFICIAKINSELYPLAIFLEFPLLLQAFLQSSRVQLENGETNRKIFMLEGVIIPDEYYTCKSCYKEILCYPSFEKLPKRLRKAIVAHYQAQQQEKKAKKKKRSCFG